MTLRRIMGIPDEGGWEEETKKFTRSTIHGNLSRLRTETLREISRLVVGEGHRLKPKAIENVRGDGFVTETSIHYPTDSSLLTDGLRVMLRMVVFLANLCGLPGWRQHKHLLRKGKAIHRKIVRAAGKNRAETVKEGYVELLAHVQDIRARVLGTLAEMDGKLKGQDLATIVAVEEHIRQLREYADLTARVAEQARRRVLLDDPVENDQKLFSLFERYTDLIKRGKEGVAFEFGRRVMILEDAAGFIIEARVLERGQFAVRRTRGDRAHDEGVAGATQGSDSRSQF